MAYGESESALNLQRAYHTAWALKPTLSALAQAVSDSPSACASPMSALAQAVSCYISDSPSAWAWKPNRARWLSGWSPPKTSHRISSALRYHARASSRRRSRGRALGVGMGTYNAVRDAPKGRCKEVPANGATQVQT